MTSVEVGQDSGPLGEMASIRHCDVMGGHMRNRDGDDVAEAKDLLQTSLYHRRNKKRYMQ